MFFFIFFLWQPYIADVGQQKIQPGMERSGLPEGIPSLREYLAEYCSLAVSAVTIYVQFRLLYHLLWLIDIISYV